MRTRVDQSTGIGVLRMPEDGVGQSILDDRAVVHDCDPFADFADHGEVMRYQDDCDLVLPPQIRKQFDNLGLYRYIEGGAPVRRGSTASVWSRALERWRCVVVHHRRTLMGVDP